MNHRKVFTAGVVLIIVAVLLPVLTDTLPVPEKSSSMVIKTISVAATTIKVEIADTELKRKRGLSGRMSLAEGSGMLFVFEESGMWGIWMKDMRFPLDIIWLNTNHKVITIASQVVPDSFPTVFYPSAPAQYVIEVPAGFVKSHSIAEGVTFVL